MNIFIIPSWYPSPDEPGTGIFFREQAAVYAQHFQEDHLGICSWGQNDHRLLLPLREIHKWPTRLLARHLIKQKTVEISSNCNVYSNPAFSWTRRIWRGNLRSILAACEKSLVRFQQDHGPCDVLHAHVAFPAGFIAQQLSEKYGIPYIVTEHMGPFPMPGLSDVFATFCLDSYTNAHLVLAVSKELQGQMSDYGIDCQVHHNFIDDEQFQPKRMKKDQAAFRLLTVGRLEQGKGHRALIEACALLAELPFQLEIIGEGSLMKDLKDLVSEKGLSEKVRMCGWGNRDQVKKALPQSDAFVFPSEYESFGLAALEAIACGIPLVATGVGEVKNMITSDTGVVIAEVNPASIAESLKWMMDNRGRFDSEKIRKFYTKHYSAKYATSELRGHYERISNQSASWD